MSSLGSSRPWWRELWPWLLIAGPALTIVSCIVTIVLAVRYFGDQPLTDGAVKRGLKVERITAAPPAHAVAVPPSRQPQ